jgi:hypothetical protein
MLNQYYAEFKDIKFIMSCGTGTAVRDIIGLQSVTALYIETDIRSASIDMHLYETDISKMEKFLKLLVNLHANLVCH